MKHQATRSYKTDDPSDAAEQSNLSQGAIHGRCYAEVCIDYNSDDEYCGGYETGGFN